uniref:putative LAGLIDADG homing endonuclease n=1 Tax=Watanabea sichuanensis TaxID=2704660 RepID=UPI0024117FE5|nr:putative LAGLIDADG homing endonuclease [Watanabea sichuanensis]WDY13143.1 putative LAGLIDADG homing endonuclease [Watanabea sichuanensis]
MNKQDKIEIGSSETTREAPHNISTTNLRNTFQILTPEADSCSGGLVFAFSKSDPVATSELCSRSSSFVTKQVKTISHFEFKEYTPPQHKAKIDFSFLEWFIGFAEGDASFYSRIDNNRHRLGFSVCQNDAKILHRIRSTLGFGTILSFTRKEKVYWQYRVEDKQGIQRIMSLFNGNLVFPKRYIQFQKWVNLRKDIWSSDFVLKEQRVIPSLQNGWLSGFIEAKGCFYANFRLKTHHQHTNTYWGFDQKLTLTQQDLHGEREVLQQIAFLMESGLSPLQKKARVRLVKKSKVYRIEFCSLAAQTILIAYLEKFSLYGQKNIAFKRWWRIYLRRQTQEIYTPRIITRLKKLCVSINRK